MKAKLLNLMVLGGLLLIAAGIVIPFITKDIHNDTFRYLFAAGAISLFCGRLFDNRDAKGTRLKRLFRIELWSSLFFLVAAGLLFYDKGNLRDSVAFVMAGALIQVYTSIMIPREAKKEKNL